MVKEKSQSDYQALFDTCSDSIGMDDAGNVVGVQNAKKLMEDIPNKIISKMSIYPDVRQIEKDGKDVIEIEVAPSIARRFT